MPINDDADLDGNWAPGGDDFDNDDVANTKTLKPKKKTRKLSVLNDEDTGATNKTLMPKKRKRKLSVLTDEDTGVVSVDPWTLGASKSVKTGKRPPNKACQAEIEEPPQAESANRKRRRKRAAKLAAARLGARPLPAEGFAQWSAVTLADAWAAEVKYRKLSPLEADDIAPDVAWFVSSSPATALVRLPRAPGVKSLSDNQLSVASGLCTLQAMHKKKGKGARAPKPLAASILVLCSCAERCFELVGQVRDAWGVKPLVLAGHGGGRKADQIARQSKALEKGVALAIASPGRAMRLAEDGAFNFEGCEVVVLDLACDQKGQSLLTLHSTRQDLFGVLKKHVVPLLQKGDLRLLMSGNGTEDA